MRTRHIVALVAFALAISALVKRATIMFPILLDAPLPSISYIGLLTYYVILFLIIALVAVAIAFSPLLGDDLENQPPSDRR